jgi:hypothetical protein
MMMMISPELRITLLPSSVIYVPAIVLAELYYLNEKAGKRVDFTKGGLRIADISINPSANRYRFMPTCFGR